MVYQSMLTLFRLLNLGYREDQRETSRAGEEICFKACRCSNREGEKMTNKSVA